MQGRVEAGVLHPGAMGASLGATLRQNCEAVLWAAQGRSPETHHRAQQAGLTEVPDLSALASRAQVIVSICPPHAAEEVARDVARHAGPELELYIDANAVAPATVERIAELFDQDRVVDAALVGPPAWQPGTFLWLSGPRAEEAAELFADTPLDVRVLGDRLGQASMAKVCFALQSKAMPTIWLAMAEAASAYGVLAPVREVLAEDGIDLDAQLASIERRARPKAWRWAGEMDEAAAALAALSLPDGWSRAAADTYRRVADGTDADACK
ncbi:DUF1932 domain-containing protein [Actinocrinis sp.]|uniref:DUF1932 domain-containing protein n=1 Tax=Actinocrinis sp. TaxID=1920516 RepID=UPI002D40ABE9|nr:DUF1932 domain-containing protein [Actinocrinis sp.]HZP55073.1 DUF1932 domain-containing protein [Actinocrinis sp.]